MGTSLNGISLLMVFEINGVRSRLALLQSSVPSYAAKGLSLDRGLWWAPGSWWGTWFRSIEPPNGAPISRILPMPLFSSCKNKNALTFRLSSIYPHSVPQGNLPARPVHEATGASGRAAKRQREEVALSPHRHALAGSCS
jgi:hypothetical protein